ncbi:ribonuclease H-like domain-containing protein [Candidatus Woesearchaeota archaeon]|nr:ribonuclease H-like domain-containing protein [Candidatus Woesearchaeota archaeon]
MRRIILEFWSGLDSWSRRVLKVNKGDEVMLRESFIFLPRVSYTKEANIWAQHITDWNEFLSTPKVKGFSGATKDRADDCIRKVKGWHYQDNVTALAQALPANEHWRLYNEYKEDAVFLDIETEGEYGNITVVGLFDGEQTSTFVRGINLDRALLKQQLQKYKLIITYNGSSFDLPVIKKYFQIAPTVPHIDLRGVCHRVGLVGGLKAIERQLGIKRPDSIQYVNGNDAAELWHCWKATGDRDFLEMLVTYNEEDIVNLQPIAERAVRMLWGKIRNI